MDTACYSQNLSALCFSAAGVVNGRCSEMSNGSQVSGMAAQLERARLGGGGGGGGGGGAGGGGPSPRVSQLPPMRSPSASSRSERFAK